MKLEFITHGESTEVEVAPGVITVGGSAQDGVQIPGLPHGFVELRIEGSRLMVVGKDVFTVDDVLSPPGVPRLVLAGEKVGLSDWASLRQVVSDAHNEPVGTAAVLKSLLSGIDEPEQANCATLTCLTGLDVGRRYPIAGELTDVGRGEAVHIRVRDRAVSRKHARIRRTADGYVIEDLKTPNGVFVNGRRIVRPTPLRDGAIVELGQSLLRFRGPIEPLPPPPPPEPQSDVELQAGDPATASPPEVSETSEAPQRREAPFVIRKLEIALIGLGFALAVGGAVVAFGFLSGT